LTSSQTFAFQDETDAIEVPLDGQTGRDTEPFVAEPDANGNEFPMALPMPL